MLKQHYRSIVGICATVKAPRVGGEEGVNGFKLNRPHISGNMAISSTLAGSLNSCCPLLSSLGSF
jgi:hypothetical protein